MESTLNKNYYVKNICRPIVLKHCIKTIYFYFSTEKYSSCIKGWLQGTSEFEFNQQKYLVKVRVSLNLVKVDLPVSKLMWSMLYVACRLNIPIFRTRVYMFHSIDQKVHT